MAGPVNMATIAHPRGKPVTNEKTPPNRNKIPARAKNTIPMGFLPLFLITVFFSPSFASIGRISFNAVRSKFCNSAAGITVSWVVGIQINLSFIDVSLF
ncbi:MAG: hypothetical protein FWF60_06195 [Oscillospiraceae bacterium]|nr:hypothetical protein [Oscillospiraceae bacterium]